MCELFFRYVAFYFIYQSTMYMVLENYDQFDKLPLLITF